MPPPSRRGSSWWIWTTWILWSATSGSFNHALDYPPFHSAPHQIQRRQVFIPIWFWPQVQAGRGDDSFPEQRPRKAPEPPSLPVAASLQAGVGFADTDYSVDIAENSAGNAVIKVLVLTNKPSLSFPLQCTIQRGNEKGHFDVVANANRDCELRTRGQQLDYETQRLYVLNIAIETLSSLIDPSRSLAQMVLNVKDVNDNRPRFLFPELALVPDTFLAVVPRDAPADSVVFKLAADDRDSGDNARLAYLISPSRDSDFFAIDSANGLVTTTRSFHGLDPSRLPFRLTVTARDQPGASTGFLETHAPLIVNLLDDRYRLVLVLAGTTPEAASQLRPRIKDFLQERSGLVIGIEKVEVLSNRPLNTTGGSGGIAQRGPETELTFYAIDPLSLHIMPYSDSRMESFFLHGDGQYSLLFSISTALGVSAVTIRPPLTSAPAVLLAAKTAEDMDGFQAALLALACIIATLGIAGIVYLCFLWSRYKTYRLRLQQMLVSPRMEPVFVEPNLKEYETQVLRMNVLPDDSELDYLHSLDLKAAADLGLTPSLTDSESLDENGATQTYGSRDELECVGGTLMVPALNPIYQSSDETNGGARRGRTRHAHLRLSSSPLATTEL